MRTAAQRWNLFALSLFLLLGLTLVWPALKRGEEAVIGQRFDNYWIWNLKPRLNYNQANNLPWRDDVLIGYPYHLLRPELEPLQPFLYTVLLKFFGPATIVNLLGLTAFVVSGYFTYRLIAYLTNLPLLGLAAGVAFLYRLIPAVDGNMFYLPLLFFPPLVYSSFRLQGVLNGEGEPSLSRRQAGPPRFAIAAFSLIGLLFVIWQGFHQWLWLEALIGQAVIGLLVTLIGTLLLPGMFIWLGRHRPSWQPVFLWSAVIGLLVTLIATTKIEFTVFAASFLGSTLLMAFGLAAVRRISWGRLGVAAVTIGLVMTFFYGPFFYSLWRELTLTGQSLGGVRPVTLEEIREFSPSLGEIVNLSEPVVVFVLLSIVVLIFGAWRKTEGRSERSWLLIGLLLLVVAVFSTVEPSGPLSLAFWLQKVGIESLRRFNNNLYLVWLLYLVVASLGLRLVFKFVSKSQTWRIGVLIAGVLILLSGLPEGDKRRLTTQELVTPPVYQWLEGRPESVIVEYPLAPAIDQIATEYFAWQGVHQKALVAGLDLKDEAAYSALQTLTKDGVDHLSLLGAEILIIYPGLDQQITNLQVGEKLYYQFPEIPVLDDQAATRLGLELEQVFGRETGREAAVYRVRPRPSAGRFSEQPQITKLLERGRAVSGTNLEARGVEYAENEGSWRGEGELRFRLPRPQTEGRLAEFWIETFLPGPSQASLTLRAGPAEGRLTEVARLHNGGRISYMRRVIINPTNYVAEGDRLELAVEFSTGGGAIEPRLRTIELVEY